MKTRNWGRIIPIASAHGPVASVQKAIAAKHLQELTCAFRRQGTVIVCAAAMAMLAAPIAVAQPCDQGAVLAPQVLQGFVLLAKHDTNGFGVEASQSDAWRVGRTGLRLCRSADGGTLSDDAGATLAISAGFAQAIDRLVQYFSLPTTELDAPARLRAVLLSEPGVAAVRRLFEVSIEQRVRVGRRELVPEVHGQATLANGVIDFRMLPNPLTNLLQRLRNVAGDRAALTRLYQSESDAMKLLDERGAFRRFLFQTLPAWEAADRPPVERRRATVDFHLDTMAEEAATVIAVGSLKENLKLMIDHDWSGRHVGIWHTHPPALTGEGIVGEPEHLRGPSEADMEVALKSGQNLTIAFVEDGFDAWDLSGMTTGADAESPHRLLRHRSAAWREHFRELRQRLALPASR